MWCGLNPDIFSGQEDSGKSVFATARRDRRTGYKTRQPREG
jgi:hypothetical protein